MGERCLVGEGKWARKLQVQQTCRHKMRPTRLCTLHGCATAITPVPTRPAGLFPGDPAQGIVSLGGYVTFWGWFFTAVTVLLALFKPEGRDAAAAATAADAKRLADAESDAESPSAAGLAARNGGRALGIEQPAAGSNSRAGSRGVAAQWSEMMAAYRQLWRVVKLPAIWALSALLVTYR